MLSSSITNYTYETAFNLKSMMSVKNSEIILTLQEELKQYEKQYHGCIQREIFENTTQVLKIVEEGADRDILYYHLKPATGTTDPDSSLQCLRGTREQVIYDISAWIFNPGSTPILWLHGHPGCGKSTLSHTIAYELDEKKKLGGCFFCKRDSDKLREPRRLLPTLAYKLALKSAWYRKCLCKSLENKEISVEMSVMDQYEHLFGRVSQQEGNSCDNSMSQNIFTFVIDALDECGDEYTRKDLLDCIIKLSTLWKWLRIFVTSRQYKDIHSKFNDNRSVVSMNLSHRDPSTDIEAFIRSELNMSGRLKLDISNEQIGMLVHKSDKLFIWASTVMKYLRNNCNYKKDLERILARDAPNAVSGLENMYTFVLDLIANSQDHNKSLIRDILSIVVASAQCEPVLCEVLIRTLNTQFDTAVVEQFLDKLLPVLKFDIKSNSSIRVQHLSFLNYLEDKTKCSVAFWSNYSDSCMRLCTGCIGILKADLRFNICNIESSFLKNKDIKELEERRKKCISVTLNYASKYWTYYVPEEVTANSADHFLPLIHDFLKRPHVLFWIEIFSISAQVPALLDCLDVLYRNMNKVCSHS